jgi:CBS domain-containing protein
MGMKSVKQILDSKGHDIWSLHPDGSVLDAVKLMAEKEVGALLVMEEAKLVGIVSERDYARKVILKGRSSEDTRVAEIMTANVLFVHPDESVDDCMALMTEKRIRHLPIVEGEQVIGVLSLGDLVKAVIAEQKFMIDQLEHYISG